MCRAGKTLAVEGKGSRKTIFPRTKLLLATFLLGFRKKNGGSSSCIMHQTTLCRSRASGHGSAPFLISSRGYDRFRIRTFKCRRLTCTVDRPVGDSQIRRMRTWHAHCEGILVHSHAVFRALNGLHKCFRDLGAEDPIKIPTV